ncbi:hypothetical protein [Aquirufa sp.]|jgi:hypothetical protein|uniref:hypothetical protein n=1 Tax=Aquirufa sp. TaxID=2676249 RepID=UPI003783F8C1
MSNNAIATPRQLFTLNFPKKDVENKIKYLCEKLPTYVFMNQNETLNSMRIEAKGAFLSQHMDFRFQNTDEDICIFELEVSKSTGGMTNDDSILKAKKNIDEFMEFLTKCLEGYEISEEDIKKLKKSQTNNMIFYVIFFIILLWFFFGGGLEMLL